MCLEQSRQVIPPSAYSSVIAVQDGGVGTWRARSQTISRNTRRGIYPRRYVIRHGVARKHDTAQRRLPDSRGARHGCRVWHAMKVGEAESVACGSMVADVAAVGSSHVSGLGARSPAARAKAPSPVARRAGSPHEPSQRPSQADDAPGSAAIVHAHATLLQGVSRASRCCTSIQNLFRKNHTAPPAGTTQALCV